MSMMVFITSYSKCQCGMDTVSDEQVVSDDILILEDLRGSGNLINVQSWILLTGVPLVEKFALVSIFLGWLLAFRIFKE